MTAEMLVEENDSSVHFNPSAHKGGGTEKILKEKLSIITKKVLANQYENLETRL